MPDTETLKRPEDTTDIGQQRSSGTDNNNNSNNNIQHEGDRQAAIDFEKELSCQGDIPSPGSLEEVVDYFRQEFIRQGIAPSSYYVLPEVEEEYNGPETDEEDEDEVLDDYCEEEEVGDEDEDEEDDSTMFFMESKSEPWLSPDLEPDRIWHEPEVLIYNTSVTPGKSSSANAYDIANRRWYELNVVDSETKDEEDWMSDVITKHVVGWQTQFECLPNFNVINTTRDEKTTTFDKKEIEKIAPRIRGNLHYGSAPSDIFPTTTFDRIKRKEYLSCSSDRCVWKDRECVFKRIEFDEDLAIIQREIVTRELLVAALQESGATMESRFHILPILAVVHKHSSTDEIIGILLPYGGKSLEALAGGQEYGMQYEAEDMEQDPAPDPGPKLPITERQFQGLVLAVWELARIGIVHGDINDRNTLLSPDGQLNLVDLGEVEPDYRSDAYALGNMMLWAMERVQWESTERERIRNIGRALQSMWEGLSGGGEEREVVDTAITMEVEGLEI